MADEKLTAQFDKIAQSYGLDDHTHLNPMVGELLLQTRPGEKFGQQILNYCNETATSITTPFTPEEMSSAFATFALGLQKAADMHGDIMNDFTVVRTVGKPPKEYTQSFYNRGQDKLVITAAMVREWMLSIRMQKEDPSGYSKIERLPHIKMSAPESMVQDAYELAFAANQLNKAENLNKPTNDPALIEERNNATDKFIEQMQSECMVGNFMAHSKGEFVGINYSQAIDRQPKR